MMDDSKDSTKDAGKRPPVKTSEQVIADISAEGAELSLEDLDKVLEEDPEFQAQLNDIRKEKLNILGDADLIEIKFPTPDLNFKETAKRVLTDFRVQFGRWSFFQKLSFVILVLSLPALGFYFTYVFKKGVIHPSNKIYVASMEEWADNTYQWDPQVKEEREAFYGSLRIPLYIYSLKKMIVNLKTHESSPSNAMIALEIVAEGTTPEVVTELKEKESYYRDVFQQELSQMSFDGITESDGKTRMLERLRRVANETLEQGKLKKLYLKNIIVKK
ncbi:MAG: flagellar basal body-associated FliL family protein [Bdellovibrionota bacterium]